MVPGAFKIAGDWKSAVKNLPETGMGYTVVTIHLKNGAEFRQVVIDSGFVSLIKNLPNIPFIEADIAQITPTHDKWDWKN